MDKYVANGASLLQCTHVRILKISYSGGIGNYKDYFCIHY